MKSLISNFTHLRNAQWELNFAVYEQYVRNCEDNSLTFDGAPSKKASINFKYDARRTTYAR